MARKNAEVVEVTESLLPSIREEEARLKAELDSVRLEAERDAAEAERAAAERVRTTREALPGTMEERRRAVLRELEAEARARRTPEGEIERAVEAQAERGMAAAVAAVLARVLPGGTA